MSKHVNALLNTYIDFAEKKGRLKAPSTLTIKQLEYKFNISLKGFELQIVSPESTLVLQLGSPSFYSLTALMYAQVKWI
jgi:hypothetical protein